MYKRKIVAVADSDFQKVITEIGFKKWNVDARKPFGGPAQVIEYLGRYTHKVAITHHRIISISDTTITFGYKDYRDGNKVKVMALSHEEFARRFEKHILPKGFVKIRSYGFMKNYNKTVRLNALRESMHLPPAPPKVRIPVQQRMLEKYGRDITLCPKCERGKMVLKETFRAVYRYQINLHQQNSELIQNNNSS